MDTVPPSYQSATARDVWSIIAQYIPSSDLCSVALVCRRWHKLFMPFLWGDPASHFGTDNDAVYVALTRFRRTLKYARLEVRMLTHTLHLPPALSEIYGGPRPEWLREILEFLPNLQSLMVSKLPFFDHNAMMALKSPAKHEPPNAGASTYNIRLLLAEGEPNTTSQGLAETLLRFQELIYLDLSYTIPARDRIVLSALSQLQRLQVLKLRGIGLEDSEAEFLANAIGTRVRLLDVRNNLLTDVAVRSLLQASFFPLAFSTSTNHSRGPFRFHDGILNRAALDEHFVKALTQPLTGRSWVEDLSPVGITHLYIADNHLTVEGVASLLASSRLHVLDVGTVDAAGSIGRAQRSKISSPIDEVFPNSLGAEKLVPIGSTAKDNLTYLRVHHSLCTADAQLKESLLPHNLLPELLDPDEPLLQVRKGSILVPEVIESNLEGEKRCITTADLCNNGSSKSIEDSDNHSEAPKPVPRCVSPISVGAQRIQELLAKQPKNQSLPRRDGKGSFSYQHPSHVRHLETLVLTDVPSHVPAGSPILGALIRFITSCSDEALLATLQAESDYSLPPGRARARAVQERSRSLFALRRLVLEITPTSSLEGPARLGSWKSINQQNGASRSSTGDRDSENMWSAAAGDFSFFEEDECETAENPGKHFPMAVLNEKVTLIPEEDDSGHVGTPKADVPVSPNSLQPVGADSQRDQSRHSSFSSLPGSTNASRSRSTITKSNRANPPSMGKVEIDLVAELAAFRRAKRLEYERVVRNDRERRIMSLAASSRLFPSVGPRPVSPSPSLRALAEVSAPHLSAHHVEGHWKGEVKIVRNAAKG